jgi:hypothetical protein
LRSGSTAGDQDFPFARREFYEYGLGAADSLLELDGSYFYVSQDDKGAGMVFRGPKRISTFAIEKSLKESSNLAGCSAYGYQDGGHSFYVLNVPGLNFTWVYDVATGIWHTRTYTNAGVQERHRGENHMWAFGKHLIGDYQNGNLYYFSESAYADVKHSDTTTTAEITAIRRGFSIDAQGKMIFISEFAVDAETGVGPTPSLTTDGLPAAADESNWRDPVIIVRCSKDNGHTWSNEREMSLGQAGKYKTRARLLRWGSGRSYQFEIKITDPVKRNIQGAFVRVEVGQE